MIDLNCKNIQRTEIGFLSRSKMVGKYIINE